MTRPSPTGRSLGLRVLLIGELGGDLADQLGATAALEVERVSVDEASEHLGDASYAAIVLRPSGSEAAWSEAIRRVRSAAPATPLVVVGGREDDRAVLGATSQGAQESVTLGSTDVERLRLAVRESIERKRTEDEARWGSEDRIRAFLRVVPDKAFWLRRGIRGYELEPGHVEPDGPTEGLEDETLPRQLLAEHPSEVEAALAGQPRFFPCQLAGEGPVPRDYEVRLAASAPDEVLAVFRDVTASKRLEQQVEISQRLEAVGRLAGGMAHDFNNILTIVIGSAELALREPSLAPETRQALEDICGTAERAATLTHQLLAFSRKQILKMAPLDVNALIFEVAEMLRRLIGEDIAIETRLNSRSSTVRADRVQIEQIFMNLAVNARDAMPAGGTLLFETDDVDVYETHFGHEVEISSGSYVTLAVSDTGVGMDAATRARAFEPFFTTKERGKGTGLGLASVYGIVKQSGGYVWIYSEPGLGTTVKIYLPSVAAPAAPPEKPESATVGGSRGERILLVEDDPTVLEVARRFLAAEGYVVIPASTIESAIELVESLSEPIDLLATDVVLPGMSGRDLAERLHALRPGIKTLYISGYTEDAIAQHGVLEPGVAFLEKPYSRRQLLEAVRRAIDAGD